ncbi:unnamed protein product, partial [Ectocarpus fasciculatus]
ARPRHRPCPRRGSACPVGLGLSSGEPAPADQPLPEQRHAYGVRLPHQVPPRQPLPSADGAGVQQPGRAGFEPRRHSTGPEVLLGPCRPGV